MVREREGQRPLEADGEKYLGRPLWHHLGRSVRCVRFHRGRLRERWQLGPRLRFLGTSDLPVPPDEKREDLEVLPSMWSSPILGRWLVLWLWMGAVTPPVESASRVSAKETRERAKERVVPSVEKGPSLQNRGATALRPNPQGLAARQTRHRLTRRRRLPLHLRAEAVDQRRRPRLREMVFLTHGGATTAS